MGSNKTKYLAAILTVILAVAAMTGVVYAYLSATSGSVENTFTVASTHTIGIKETIATTPDNSNLVKQNVRVDAGKPGYAVYVRVAIVVTWKNEENHIHGQKPVMGTDYALDLNAEAWFEGADGFYYLSTMFVGDDVNLGLTPILLNRCYQLNEGPDDYNLHVEIIAQTIQAKGSTDKVDANGKPIPAVTDAWGIEVNQDGTLKKPATNP